MILQKGHYILHNGKNTEETAENMPLNIIWLWKFILSHLNNSTLSQNTGSSKCRVAFHSSHPEVQHLKCSAGLLVVAGHHPLIIFFYWVCLNVIYLGAMNFPDTVQLVKPDGIIFLHRAFENTYLKAFHKQCCILADRIKPERIQLVRFESSTSISWMF